MYRPRLAEQFENLDKQGQALRLGMWLFLASEVLLFAALFALYASYRAMYGSDFLRAAGHNDNVLGTANTFILITSSFSVAMAIQSARTGKIARVVPLLGVTLALGVAFLVVKGIEYSHHFHEGIYPGRYYRYAELDTYGAKCFFTLYYLMSGLHAVHVVLGLGALTFLLVWHRRTPFGPEHNMPLELGGLYWHLIDVIWIFLWPMLYLTHD